MLRLMAFLQACLGAPSHNSSSENSDKFLGLFPSAPSWALSVTLYLQLWSIGHAELGSPSQGSGHGPWTHCTRLCTKLPPALTGRLVEKRIHDEWISVSSLMAMLDHDHTTGLVFTWWGHWDQESAEYHMTSLRWFVSSQGGLHLTHPSRQCFLSCGHKSLADYENNLMGCNYHLKKKYNSVESKIDGCVVCNKLSIVVWNFVLPFAIHPNHDLTQEKVASKTDWLLVIPVNKSGKVYKTH